MEILIALLAIVCACEIVAAGKHTKETPGKRKVAGHSAEGKNHVAVAKGSGTGTSQNNHTATPAIPQNSYAIPQVAPQAPAAVPAVRPFSATQDQPEPVRPFAAVQNQTAAAPVQPYAAVQNQPAPAAKSEQANTGQSIANAESSPQAQPFAAVQNQHAPAAKSEQANTGQSNANAESSPQASESDDAEATANAAIEKLNELSKGSGSIDKFSIGKKGDCETVYNIVRDSEVTLQHVLDTFFGSGKVPLKNSSNHFIRAEHYSFHTTDGAITISSCANKKVFKVENVETSVTETPTIWMTVNPFIINSISFFYDEMLLRKAHTEWSRIGMVGHGDVHLGVSADKQMAKITFTKELEPQETDVLIKVTFFGNTFLAADFLRIFDHDIDELYPESSNPVIDNLQLDTLSFGKGENSFTFSGLVSDEHLYAASITGEVGGSTLLSGTQELHVLCQNSPYSIHDPCALVGLVDTDTFDFNGMVDNLELESIANEVKFFHEGKLPSNLIFQSSKTSIEVVNVPAIENLLQPYILNDKRRDADSARLPSITNDTCLRFMIAGINTIYPNLPDNNDKNMVVQLKPSVDFIEFSFPDLGPLPIYFIPLLLTNAESLSTKYKEYFGDNKMIVSSIEVFKGDSGGTGYKYVTKMHPEQTVEGRSFKINPKFPFIEVKENPVQFVSENMELTFAGKGEEVMMTRVANFTLSENSADVPIMNGYIKVHNNGRLLKDLMNYGDVENENDLLSISSFEMLKNLPMHAIGFSLKAADNKLMFTGNPLLGNETDITYQLVVYHQATTTLTSMACLSSHDTAISEFLNPIYEKMFFLQTWIRVSNIGLLMFSTHGPPKDASIKFSSDTCNAYIADGNTATAVADEEVFLFATDIDLSHCKPTNMRARKSCRFLNKAFGGQTLSVALTGHISKDRMKLDGYAVDAMTVGPMLSMTGFDHSDESKDKKILFSITVNKDVDQVILRGVLKYTVDETRELPCEIMLAGDVVTIQILASVETRYRNFFQTDYDQFIKVVNTESFREMIPDNLEVTELEMNAKMEIGPGDSGESGDREILKFHNRAMVRQYIKIQSDKIETKFYACCENVTVRSVMGAFAEPGFVVPYLLQGSVFSTVCATYHDGKEKHKWVLKELDIRASPGLRFYGSIYPRFGQDSQLRFTMMTEDHRARVCVYMPELQWDRKTSDADTDDVEKNKVFPALEMFANKDYQNLGPRLCYFIQYESKRIRGNIQGHIRGFGMDVPDQKILIRRKGENPYDSYELEYTGSLFNEVNGSVVLSADYGGENPNEINFLGHMNIEQDVKNRINRMARKVVKKRRKEADKAMKKCDKYLKKFNDWKKIYEDKKTAILKEIEDSQAQFSRHKIARTRAAHSYKKECLPECGYVRVPGFNVEDKCTKTRDGRSMRCMKYNKNAHVASNVGCIAHCEAERVRSLRDAVESDTDAREAGAQVDEGQHCLIKVNAVIAEINQYVVKAEEQKTQMEKLTSHRFMRDFKRIAIREFSSVIHIKDLVSASCIPFNISARLMLKNKRTEFRRYVNANRCFNGKFLLYLANFLFREFYKEEDKLLDDYVKEVLGTYVTYRRILRMRGRNYIVVKMRKLIDSFDKCRRSYPELPSTKRSSVERTMTPLHPSLFSIFGDSTSKAFHKYSPWAVAAKKDAFHHLTSAERIPIAAKEQAPKNEVPCSAARNVMADYRDVANYMEIWTKEQQSAKRTLSSVKNKVNANIDRTSKIIGTNLKNYTRNDEENMLYWISMAKKGISKWLSSESERIDKYNNRGVSLMHKELQFIYTDDKHKTLQEYFNHRSVDGSNAFKKANIPTLATDEFSELNQHLFNILEKGESLDDVRGSVEQMVNRVNRLEKRTIQCM